MSIISNIDKVIRSEPNIDNVGYLKNKIAYQDDIKNNIVKIDWLKIIDAPPKNSSVKTTRELSAISKATVNRTAKEVELVIKVDKDPNALFIDFLEKKNLRFPKAKFLTFYDFLEPYIYGLKYHFNRARPEQLAPYHNINLKIMYTDSHHTPSYPSGHTMYAELAARILSDQYPQYKSEFVEISKICGLARVLQGVHFPSDNDASVKAISVLYPLIKKGIENVKTSKEFSFDG
tara:strand:- start:15730 stop:16428 length:699 start_codon:yes stop_codon:yes gene_type:complete